MRRHVERHFGLLKTTLLGGVVFLLPLGIVGWLLGQVGAAIWPVVQALHETPELEPYTHYDWFTYTLFLAATIFALLGLCFLAGMIARRSLGRWFTGQAEKYLLMLFPRYAVFKEQLTGNLGSGNLKTVRVVVGGVTRIGMEIERSSDGEVSVYLPGSPDPWTGEIGVFPAEAVTPEDRDPADVMAAYEQLGRGLLEDAGPGRRRRL